MTSLNQALRYFAQHVSPNTSRDLVDACMNELREAARLGMTFEYAQHNEMVRDDEGKVVNRLVSKLRINTFPEHDPKDDIWEGVVFAYTIAFNRVDERCLVKMKMENRIRASALAYHASQSPTRRRDVIPLGESDHTELDDAMPEDEPTEPEGTKLH